MVMPFVVILRAKPTDDEPLVRVVTVVMCLGRFSASLARLTLKMAKPKSAADCCLGEGLKVIGSIGHYVSMRITEICGMQAEKCPAVSLRGRPNNGASAAGRGLSGHRADYVKMPSMVNVMLNCICLNRYAFSRDLASELNNLVYMHDRC